MKIGIVTFVKADNYGAELQAYALQRKLNMMGYDSEVLDLEKEQGVMASSKRNIIISLKKRIAYYGFFVGMAKFANAVLDTLRERKINKENRDKIIAKHAIFEKFFDDKIKHSSSYIRLDDLDKIDLPYDVYIAGSDQIWNYMQTNRLDVYFLKFANRFSARKISYAASFSVSEIPSDLKPLYKELIANLDAISVREENALSIIEGLSKKNAIQVLDPTLLLNKKEWVENIGINDYLPQNKKYVVIYTLSGTRYIYRLAKIIAKELDADVINIMSGFVRVKGDEGITHITDAGPQEFVSLLDKAAYVITDSFHGTAFSINFNIPFTTLLNPVSNINSRALSLLKMCQLEDRIIYDDGSNNMPRSLYVDFTDSRRIIEIYREKSLRYLIKNINNCGSV